MRALAEFVMRGRSQAIVVTVAGTLMPLLLWLSASVIAVVTLRKGLLEGGLVLLWALLPAGAAAYMGDVMPVVLLLGITLAAVVLRLSVSWSWTLCACALIGVLMSSGLYLIADAYVATIEQWFAELVNELQKQAAQGDAPVIMAPTRMDTAGLLGLTHTTVMVMCLLLARWWQSVLYNPGGFRTEFHGLRLDARQVMGLLASAAALAMLGADFRYWAWMPLLPLFFAGLGLVHAAIAARGKPGFTGLFYAALILLPPVKQLVVVLAAIDGWLDVRRRWLHGRG